MFELKLYQNGPPITFKRHRRYARNKYQLRVIMKYSRIAIWMPKIIASTRIINNTSN